MADSKEKIRKIKESYSIVDYETDSKKFKAVEGISPEEIEWVINRLYQVEMGE